jgi:hypothetical protein
LGAPDGSGALFWSCSNLYFTALRTLHILYQYTSQARPCNSQGKRPSCFRPWRDSTFPPSLERHTCRWRRTVLPRAARVRRSNPKSSFLQCDSSLLQSTERRRSGSIGLTSIFGWSCSVLNLAGYRGRQVRGHVRGWNAGRLYGRCKRRRRKWGSRFDKRSFAGRGRGRCRWCKVLHYSDRFECRGMWRRGKKLAGSTVNKVNSK